MFFKYGKVLFLGGWLSCPVSASVVVVPEKAKDPLCGLIVGAICEDEPEVVSVSRGVLVSRAAFSMSPCNSGGFWCPVNSSKCLYRYLVSSTATLLLEADGVSSVCSLLSLFTGGDMLCG